VVSRQNADVADTLHMWDVAMATIFWLPIYGVHIGATWWIRLNCPCAVAMWPYVTLLLTTCYFCCNFTKCWPLLEFLHLWTHC